MPQFLVLASICSFAGEQLLRVQSLINPAIATTRVLIKSTVMRKAYINWSDEETCICAGADEGSIMNFTCFVMLFY